MSIAHVEVAGILMDARRWMDPVMRDAVGRLHPDLGQMASYTFGWSEADGTVRDFPAGKAVRPALAGLAARLAGAEAGVAAPGAAAVELVHAFSLVHDDIMDGDELRRHRTAVWKAYGTGPAILTGDALLALALDLLARMPEPGPALGHLTATLVDLVNGQAADAAFEARPWSGPNRVSVEEYCTMAVGKTGSLLGCAAAIGSLLGGGSPELADRMSELGRHLGLAFQAVDDLLGIWGDPAITGKAVFADLRQAKKTLPIVSALATDPPGLSALLAEGQDHAGAAALIEEAGGRAFTEDLASTELDHVMRLAEGLDPAAVADLELLARYVVHRTD